MNCVPIIEYLKGLSSEVDTLPRGGQWKLLVLLDDQLVWTHSEDQKASFLPLSSARCMEAIFRRESPGPWFCSWAA
eukprot:10275926-Karenia_brevis.AAC.1